jgi:hypothetical protein
MNGKGVEQIPVLAKIPEIDHKRSQGEGRSAYDFYAPWLSEWGDRRLHLHDH